MSYKWGTCPQEIQDFVFESISEMIAIMDRTPIGVYLHGSLAMGGFNPNNSDIDLIIVTAQPLSNQQKRKLVHFLLERSSQPFPLEISLLTLSQIENWSYPTPYDFHFSEFWRARYEAELRSGTALYLNNEEKTDVDLAAHFTITHHRGIVLSGQPIHEIFPSVPHEDYLASILEDYKECLVKIHDKPVYCLLNLIRVYWYLKEGKICSKKEAGVWGIKNLPKKFTVLIERVVEAYESENIDCTFIKRDLNEARDYIRLQVECINTDLINEIFE